MRATHVIIAALVLCPWQALGQTSGAPPASGLSEPPTAREPEEWSLFASAYGYAVPDGGNYLQPTFTADRGWLHLQARYNYEDLETGSAWLGCNFSGGGTLAWEITPMVGGVFGSTAGAAFGYIGSLSWRRIELVSEGEYVTVAADSSDNFTYAWSELTLRPLDGLRFGLALQNTWVGGEDDAEPGVLLGLSFKNVDLAAYLFNPSESDRTIVAAVSLEF